VYRCDVQRLILSRYSSVKAHLSDTPVLSGASVYIRITCSVAPRTKPSRYYVCRPASMLVQLVL